MAAIDNTQNPGMVQEGALTRFLRATEIDPRMLGMVGALLVIWIGFDIFSGFLRGGEGLFGGSFLTPRNLWILLVQTSSIAVMTTGMVLVIVMRHIDLSVGSILGFTGVLHRHHAGLLAGPALGVGHPAIWIITLVAGPRARRCHRRLPRHAHRLSRHPVLHRDAGRPHRLARCCLVGHPRRDRGAHGQELQAHRRRHLRHHAGLDRRHGELDPGPPHLRRHRRRHLSRPQAAQALQLRAPPVWAEYFLAIAGCAVVLGITYVVNSYYWPKGVVDRWAQATGTTIPPEGLNIAFGYSIPVLIALGVGIAMTFLANRTRLRPLLFAIGGNPEAAELAGINTKQITVMVFSLMGMLAAISASISSARLDSATNALGQFDELYVIAAAVIGGTSLAGGLGTIYGAMLGALVMQSLQSGMTLLNFESATKDIVVGCVLVFAVCIDQVYRRRVK